MSRELDFSPLSDEPVTPETAKPIVKEDRQAEYIGRVFGISTERALAAHRDLLDGGL